MHEIATYIREDLVIDLNGTDKIDVLTQLKDAVSRTNLLPDTDAFFDKVLLRESQATTAMGMGVAIPHARVDGLADIIIVVGRSAEGIEFTTPDGMPVRLIFMIAVNDKPGEYLKILSRISWLVRNEDFRNQLFSSDNTSSLFKLLKENG